MMVSQINVWKKNEINRKLYGNAVGKYSFMKYREKHNLSRTLAELGQWILFDGESILDEKKNE